MDTPWHAFWTYVLFHRKSWWPKAVVASILVDVPFFISSVVFFLRDGVSMETWTLAYEHPFIKPIGLFAHSLVIAAIGLTIAFLLTKKNWYPYFYGWILHIITDMLTHVSDAQPVFWPLSDKLFPGPISYWESAYYGHEFGIVNLALASLFALYVVSTKNWRFLQIRTTGQIALFGVFSVYLLATGILTFRIGWTSTGMLLFYVISGILFFFAARDAYRFRKKYSK